MKKYPKMKPSGVGWIGDVPEHWGAKKLKYVAEVVTGSTPPKSDEDNYVLEGGVCWVKPDNLEGFNLIDDSKEKLSEKGASIARLVPKGSVLICGIGTIGKFGIAGQELATNQQINTVVFYENLFTSNYGKYSIPAAEKEFLRLSNKVVVAILTKSIQSEIKFPVPPPPEQTAIAHYLDRKTIQIDQAISEKERLIELLREERQAIINHAVTKGIWAGVKMKASGVEWIGDVPEHWGATVFKRVTSRIVVGIAEAATGSYVDKGVPIIRATNIKEGKILGELIQIEASFAEKNESKAIKAFDIITVRTGYPGQSAVLPKELDGAQCFTMLISSLKESQNPFFYNLYLNSHVRKEYFGLTAWGSAQKNISVPILQDIPIPILPFEEQNEIVEYLNQKTTQIDTAISGIQQEIALLQEYRQALIFEAVTGKVDVRE